MNFDRLTRYLDQLEALYGVPGLDCKVMKDHRTVYRHMCGYRDARRRCPVGDTDLYDVYSCTKVITMTAAMQLVEQGRLQLEDDVAAYLPEFAQVRVADDFDMHKRPIRWPDAGDASHPARRRMRVVDLMTMTSGMTYQLDAEPIREAIAAGGGQADTQTIVRAMARMILPAEPGQRFIYSLSHDVVAAIVEMVSGERYADYIVNHIARPLGLKHMLLHVPKEAEDRRAAQYACDFQTGKVSLTGMDNRFRLTPSYDSGGAGLTCTVDDYCAVLDALCNDGVGANGQRILTEASVRAMGQNRLTGQALEDFRACGKVGYGYGLGMRTLIDASSALSPLGEFGWDGAAGAYALMDRTNHVCVFYAQEILGQIKAYEEIHPRIRDLVYEGLAL